MKTKDLYTPQTAQEYITWRQKQYQSNTKQRLGWKNTFCGIKVVVCTYDPETSVIKPFNFFQKVYYSLALAIRNKYYNT